MSDIKKLLRNAISKKPSGNVIGFGSAFSLNNSNLDELIGGLRPGQVALASCEMHQVNLSWAIQILHEASVLRKRPALLCTRKYTPSDVVAFLVANAANVSIASIYVGDVSDDDQLYVADAIRAIGASRMHIVQEVALEDIKYALNNADDAIVVMMADSGLSVSDAVGTARRIATECSAAVLVLAEGERSMDGLLGRVEVAIQLSVHEPTKTQSFVYPIVFNVVKSPIVRGAIRARFYPRSARISFNSW
jgi:hypothetical protein